MAERFYLNCELKPGENAVLGGAEAHHLAHVSRLREGDAVCLFNGNGHDYPAFIREIRKKQVTLVIASEQVVQRELPFSLVVAAPLPKGDRATFLIEKLTEFGATTFVPLRTERSVVHPGDGKLEKLRRHVIEASKQCGRNVLMQVESVTGWRDFCNHSNEGVRIVAHFGGKPIRELKWAAQDITVAVGPEGGWTDDEMVMANEANWRTVDCGPRTMRIETAALFLAGCITVMA